MAGNKKHRRIILWGLLSVMLIAGTCLFYNLVITSDKTVSPNNEYRTAYNRITKVVTLEAINGGVRGYFGECENPALLWSPDSKFLSMTITGENGNRRSEIMSLENNNSLGIPTKFDIQALSGQTQSAGGNDSQIEVTKWLDNDNVLVEFTWPDDERITSGWFIFEFSSYSVKELTFAE